MSAALQTIPDQSLFTMKPRTLAEAMEYSKLIAETDMVPKDFRGKPGNVLVAVQMGMELGLPPLQALQSIAVINGRPSLWGDGLLALVLAQPDLEDITEDDLVAIREKGAATCTIKRRGREPKSVTFGVDDAKEAGLWGKQGPWSQYPARMLQMRARGFACRDVYADVLRGVRMAEEERDVEHARRVEVEVRDSQEREQSTAKRVRAKLAAKIESAAPVTLESVLNAIEKAESEADLIAMKPLGQKLEERDKEIAIDAWKRRRGALQSKDAAPSLLDRIKAATTKEQLDEVKGEILTQESLDDAVVAAYEAKAKELKAAQ